MRKINPSPEISSSVPDLTAEVPLPSSVVSSASLPDVTEKTPVPSSDPPPIVSEPEEGAKSISMETESSIITITKKPTSEDGFSVPDAKKRARAASPNGDNDGVELSNSFSPLAKSPSSKKQAVSVAEGSEVDASSPSTSQPSDQSCRPKPQELTRPVKDASKVQIHGTKIPSDSTPRAGESKPASRKLKFSREDFVKSPIEKPSQSKQDKTGKKHP